MANVGFCIIKKLQPVTFWVTNRQLQSPSKLCLSFPDTSMGSFLYKYTQDKSKGWWLNTLIKYKHRGGSALFPLFQCFAFTLFYYWFCQWSRHPKLPCLEKTYCAAMSHADMSGKQTTKHWPLLLKYKLWVRGKMGNICKEAALIREEIRTDRKQDTRHSDMLKQQLSFSCEVFFNFFLPCH